MKLHELKSQGRKNKKRPGRGIAAGGGKTAGRGTKGQKARSARKIPRRFAGGETALILRLPKKKGFRSSRPKPTTVSLASIDAKFKAGDKITPKTLFEKGLIKDWGATVKILGKDELKKKLTFQGLKLSGSLKAKIQKIKNNG